MKIERRSRLLGRHKKKVRKLSSTADYSLPMVLPADNPLAAANGNYDSKIYCYCQQRSEGDMIECDNPNVFFKGSLIIVSI